MEDFTEYVPNVHFEQIPIRNLVSNQDYQRNISNRHIRRAAEHFDLYQINPVKVSRRNGVNFVFNGQHTIEIVALVSGSRDTPVWCMVYDDLEYTHEADIFANQQKYVKALSPYEIFKANIEAGNQKELVIRDLVESYGLKISSNKMPGSICAVSSLEQIYDKYGLDMLSRVLRLVIATWEGDPGSFTANMLKGLALLLNAYDEDMKDDIFQERLSRISTKEIVRNAKEKRTGSLGYAETMLFYYNRKLRNPLHFERLYIKKKLTGYPRIDENEDDAINQERQYEFEGQEEEETNEQMRMEWD